MAGTVGWPSGSLMTSAFFLFLYFPFDIPLSMLLANQASVYT